MFGNRRLWIAAKSIKQRSSSRLAGGVDRGGYRRRALGCGLSFPPTHVGRGPWSRAEIRTVTAFDPVARGPRFAAIAVSLRHNSVTGESSWGDDSREGTPALTGRAGEGGLRRSCGFLPLYGGPDSRSRCVAGCAPADSVASRRDGRSKWFGTASTRVPARSKPIAKTHGRLRRILRKIRIADGYSRGWRDEARGIGRDAHRNVGHGRSGPGPSISRRLRGANRPSSLWRGGPVDGQRFKSINDLFAAAQRASAQAIPRWRLAGARRQSWLRRGPPPCRRPCARSKARGGAGRRLVPRGDRAWAGNLLPLPGRGFGRLPQGRQAAVGAADGWTCGNVPMPGLDRQQRPKGASRWRRGARPDPAGDAASGRSRSLGPSWSNPRLVGQERRGTEPRPRTWLDG